MKIDTQVKLAELHITCTVVEAEFLYNYLKTGEPDYATGEVYELMHALSIIAGVDFVLER